MAGITEEMDIEPPKQSTKNETKSVRINNKGCRTSQGKNFRKIIKCAKLILPKFRTMLGKALDCYGQSIADNPVPFILGPLILTAILATGLLRLEVYDDVRFLYSPENSRSRYEYEVHRNFTGEGLKQTYCALSVESNPNSYLRKDNNYSVTNLLTPEKAKAILSLNQFVLKNMTFQLGTHKLTFGRHICPSTELCHESNLMVVEFLKAYMSREREKGITLTYPVMNWHHLRFFLPSHLYGVDYDHISGQVHSIQMIHLIYPISGTGPYSADIVAKHFETALGKYINGNDGGSDVVLRDNGVNLSDLLRVSMFSLRILKQEVQKNATYTFPFMSLTALLLVAFTLFATFTDNWISAKPLEGLFGIFSSTLSCVSAAGLLFYCGEPWISQLAVVPFIALAIGIDDTYIILGAWQRTNAHLPVRNRLGETMRDAGAAITVTSITDCLSFGIGAFSSTRAISIFCKFVAAAICFDFLYQITFFPAIVAFGGYREEKGKHCVFIWRYARKREMPQITSTHYNHHIDEFFCHTLPRNLIKPWVRCLVLILYAIYLMLALYGCSILRPNLSPSTLVVDDSQLKHYIELAERNIWSEGLVGRIYVSSAPDFSQGDHVSHKFMKMVEKFENLPMNFSIGEKSTLIWLREFLDWRGFWRYNETMFYDDLRKFLRQTSNKHWSRTLKWRNESDLNCTVHCVDKFFFSSGFQIKNWLERTELLLAWRAVADFYPEYQVVVFEENNFYSDQTLLLPSMTMQSLGIAVLAMSLVTFIFISDKFIVFWVIFTLLSMDIGIAGFLSLFGADLDPTTVVNILMSIGLSIDFSTHVAYKIYKSDLSNPPLCLHTALGAIGWPVCQGGLSTILAIIAMLLVPSYVVRQFAKTVILVVLFGTLHGLVLLPVLLATLTRREPLRKQITAYSKERKSHLRIKFEDAFHRHFRSRKVAYVTDKL